MKQFDGDPEVASQLEIDATLELASQKERLVRQTKQEIASSELLVDANEDLALRREKQAKGIREESNASSEVVRSTGDLSDAQEELASLIEDHIKSVDQSTDATDELNDALGKRIKMEEELNSRKPLVDYSEQLNGLSDNITVALSEQLEAIRRTVKAYKGEVDINDKYRKQAEKEYAHRYGLFRRINKSLEKTAKKSESGLARMGSRMLMGAGDMISDKVNDMIDSVPGLRQLNSARKFIKENMQGAKDAKTKRLIKERASKLRAEAARGEDVPDEKKKGEESKERKKEDKSESRFKNLFGILEGIKKAMMFGALFTMMGSAISAIAGAIGGLGGIITGAIASLGSLLGAKIAGLAAGISAALGKALGSIFGKKIPEIIPESMPDVDQKDNYKKDKRRTKKGERNRQRRERAKFERVPSADPDIKKTPDVKPDTKGKADKSFLKKLGGFFEKHITKSAGKKVGAAAASMMAKRMAVAAIPVVGTAAAIGMTAYDVYNMAKETGALDDISDEIKGKFDSMSESMKSWFVGDDESSDANVSAAEGEPKEKLTITATPTMESAEATPVAKIEQVESAMAEKAKKEEEARIAMAAAATGGAVSNQINQTVVNNNTTSRSTVDMPTFSSEYQTKYQRGSEIQR